MSENDKRREQREQTFQSKKSTSASTTTTTITSTITNTNTTTMRVQTITTGTAKTIIGVTPCRGLDGRLRRILGGDSPLLTYL